jgi:DNA-binding response OmpR family regulator
LLRSWGLIDGSGHRAAHEEAVPASGSSRFAAPRWFFMSKLKGREVLIVEDETLIGMELAQAFRKVGASITITSTLKQALILVEHDGLAVAILDHALGDGDSTRLCQRLTERGIPFVIYSGFNEVEGASKAGPLVTKPATGDAVVATAEGLLP